MSEAIDTKSSLEESLATDTPPSYVRPGSEQDTVRGDIPAANDLPLEDINPVWNRLFAENRMLEYFERLRRDDPVHFNETEVAGRYWSLTRYEEIKAVDSDHVNFSSAHGITLGFPIDQPLPDGALDISLFIAMDQPKHDVQRKTVAPVVSTRNLAAMESLIRERTGNVLDSLPEGETFNWVDKVSIELTTQMLATLFDFPFEERAKLTRWSDVATAVPGGGVIDTEEQRREELIECLVYFTRIWEERKENPTDDFVSMLANGKDTKDMEP
jgi:cytochrome P450